MIQNGSDVTQLLTSHDILCNILHYFTRAVPRPPGYYRALHNRSTVDVDTSREPVTRPDRNPTSGDVYEVDRLVYTRRLKVSSQILLRYYTFSGEIQGRTQYLVLCAGYRKEEASWVDERAPRFSEKLLLYQL